MLLQSRTPAMLYSPGLKGYPSLNHGNDANRATWHSFPYNLCLPWNMKAKVVNVLKFTKSVYITDDRLWLAVLSCSAFEQVHFHRSEEYLSNFSPAAGRISSSSSIVRSGFMSTSSVKSLFRYSNVICRIRLRLSPEVPRRFAIIFQMWQTCENR